MLSAPKHITTETSGTKASGTKASGTETVGLIHSSIGKKILTGTTGMGLVLFVVVHLIGNLTLFFSADAYNQIAHMLEKLGLLTYLVEGILVAIALLHIYIGINIYMGKRKARPVEYAAYASAGAPSRQSLSSRSMIVSGLAIGAFLIFHLSTFKFGTYYTLPNSSNRDLARLVFETFHKPAYAFGYVAVLSLLGLHLRHGLWSALQSVGIATRRGVYELSAVLGTAIALGFIGLPLAIYFGLIG